MKKNDETSIAIYGAQMVAVSVYYALKTLYPDCKVISFVVSRSEGNPSEIDGVPVVTIAEFARTDLKVLIATPENFHAEIIQTLQQKGICDYVCIDSKTESALMEQYYAQIKAFQSLHTLPCDKSASEDIVVEGTESEGTESGGAESEVAVYMSKFWKDRPLKGEYSFPEWIKPIQAGAALTEERVAEIADNTGENISVKNVNYSELTASYWVGKHAQEEYIGLFHYRRILDVDDCDLKRILQNDIDVVLPYPTVHYPDINEHHKRYLKESDWKAMEQALMELAPEYAAVLPEIFNGQFFYNYNMLIAKHHTMHWMLQ